MGLLPPGRVLRRARDAVTVQRRNMPGDLPCAGAWLPPPPLWSARAAACPGEPGAGLAAPPTPPPPPLPPPPCMLPGRCPPRGEVGMVPSEPERCRDSRAGSVADEPDRMPPASGRCRDGLSDTSSTPSKSRTSTSPPMPPMASMAPRALVLTHVASTALSWLPRRRLGGLSRGGGTGLYRGLASSHTFSGRVARRQGGDPMGSRGHRGSRGHKGSRG